MAIINSGVYEGGFSTTVAFDFTTEGDSDLTAGSRLIAVISHGGGSGTNVVTATTVNGGAVAMTNHVSGADTRTAIFSATCSGS